MERKRTVIPSWSIFFILVGAFFLTRHKGDEEEKAKVWSFIIVMH